MGKTLQNSWNTLAGKWPQSYLQSEDEQRVDENEYGA
jgi:hypothetical protein